MIINPPASFLLPPGAEMILIGSTEGENTFLQTYGHSPARVTQAKS